MAEGSDELCINCGANFSRKQKGWARRSLESSFATDERKPIDIIEKDLEIILRTPEKRGFLCLTCSKTLQNIAKGRRIQETAKASLVSGEGSIAKRIRCQVTPLATPRKLKWRRIMSPTKPVIRPSAGKAQTKSFVRRTDKSRAFEYIKKGQVKSGLRLLLKSKLMKSAFQEIASEITRKEFTSFVKKKDSWLRQEASIENLEDFTWHKAMQELKNDCPLLVSTLSGTLTPSRRRSQETFKKNKLLAPIVGTATAILAYAKMPLHANFLQKMNSMQMWLAGCKRELFAQFNHLHWNVGIQATRRCIDRVVANYDSVVKTWVKNSEKSSCVDAKEGGTDLDETLPYADGYSTDIDMSSGTELSPAKEHSPKTTEAAEMEGKDAVQDRHGFTLCFDNVNQKIGVRHYKKGKGPTMLNMVQLYAAKDRVPSLHLDETVPDHTAIGNLSPADILPTLQDEELLRNEMEVLVARTLCSYMPMFNRTVVRESVLWHIPHEYQEQSKRKSVMVPLGVLNKDETKTADMVDVLKEYNKFVPADERGNPSPTIVYGDGLSCERALDAKCAVVNCDDKWARLEGIEPCIQEWHKRVILLQDAFDDLYSAKSAKEKGTLYFLKQVFGHKKVSVDVKANFNHCNEFLTFVTEGYVVLSAMHWLGITTIDGIPSRKPDTEEERIELLQKVSKQVVGDIFQKQNVDSVVNARVTQKDIDASDFCICKREKGGEVMIFCDNRKCPNGSWFHLSCIDMEECDIPEGEWFCCKQCERKEKPKKAGRTKISKTLMDRKREYVRSLMWQGLNGMARRDAIRENDGERIISHWKLDLMQFYRNNHPKYLIVGIILLCQQSGAGSERLKHQLKWNRTVNPRGGAGRNIAMDLQMEFFNRDYKESAKESGGHLTDATIERHSLMVGTQKRLNDLYSLHVASKPPSKTTVGQADKSEDIKEMVKLLQPECFFQKRVRRYFTSFEDFSHVVTVQHPKKMKARLVKHQQKMAKRREVLSRLSQ